MNDRCIILRISSKAMKLEVSWFLGDLDLLESFVKHGVVIDSHKSLHIGLFVLI